jgi:hypothetical protein
LGIIAPLALAVVRLAVAVSVENLLSHSGLDPGRVEPRRVARHRQRRAGSGIHIGLGFTAVAAAAVGFLSRIGEFLEGFAAGLARASIPALGNARAHDQMGIMIIFTPNPHSLRVTPSATEPGRFGWAIWKDDVVVRRSVRSFGSEGATEAAGDSALRAVTAIWQNAR